VSASTLNIGADASLVPTDISPISNSISYDETPALLGQKARDVLESPAAACVTNGFAIYDDTDGKQIAIGDYGLTPENLERIGVIKPGSAKLVRAQVANGSTATNALPDSMFTAKYGITSFEELVLNKAAQTNMQLGLFQLSQNSLQSAGLIKGTESPDQISGLVYADSKFGTPAVIQTVKLVNTRNVNNSVVASRTTAVLREIGKGNTAAAAAASVNGPYKALAASVAAYAANPNNSRAQINAERGIRGATVDAVVNSFGGVNAFIPVSLSQLARQRGTQNASALLLVSSGGFKDYLQTSIAITGRNAINTAIELAKAGASGDQIISGFYQQTAGGAATSLNTLKSSVLGAAQGIKAAGLFLSSGQFSLAANALSTGLGGLPGGIGIAANALQSGINAATVLPGQIKDIFTTAKTAVSGFQNAVQVGSITNLTSNLTFTPIKDASGFITGTTAGFNQTGYLVDQGKTIFNAGSQAYNQIAQSVATAVTSVVAIYNAVSAIASLFGGKRKTKTVTLSNKTATRTGIRGHANAIFADPGIPRPLVFDEFEKSGQDKLNEISRQKQATAAGTQGPGFATGDTRDLTMTGGGTGAVRGNMPIGTPGSISTGLAEVEPVTDADQIVREAEALATARQNFMDNEVKAAQQDYDYAVRTRKQGDPVIAQKRDRLNYLLSNMDNLINEKRYSSGSTGGLLVNGIPYNNNVNAPSSLYNQDTQGQFLTPDTSEQSDKLSGIPPQYRAFYQRFKKLPPNAVIPNPIAGSTTSGTGG